MALTVLPGYQRNTGSSYDFSGTFAQDNSFGSSLYNTNHVGHSGFSTNCQSVRFLLNR
jgi:hypothetical protein